MRTVPVGVASDVPVYRAGLHAVLTAAGFRAEQPADPLEWARSITACGGRAALVITIPSGAAIELLRPFAHLRGVAILALTHVSSPAIQLAAVTAGASCAVGWSEDPADLLRALDAALAGMAILPSSFVRELSAREGAWAATEEQLTCLRMLKEGTPVRAIARELHYSERETFRRLRALYQSLGTRERRVALDRAIELGLV
jgi:DNA-binding NarL/FixJ family response regulator